MSWDSKQSVGRTDPASDLIPMTAIAYPGGTRAFRCLTAGTFTFTSIDGVSRTTQMFNPGEVLSVGARAVTNIASGTFEVLL